MERGRTSRGEQGGKPEDSAVLAASLQRLPQEDGVITWVRLRWVVKGGRPEDWPLKSATWGSSVTWTVLVRVVVAGLE